MSSVRPAPDRELGRGPGRPDRRDADAVRAQLAVEPAGQPDLGELRRGVDRFVAAAAEPGDRGHDDDVALARLAHLGDGGTDRPDRAGDVRVEHGRERLVGVVEDAAVHADPGVGDERVELPEALDRGRDQPAGVVGRADVHLDRDDPAPGTRPRGPRAARGVARRRRRWRPRRRARARWPARCRHWPR